MFRSHAFRFPVLLLLIVPFLLPAQVIFTDDNVSRIDALMLDLRREEAKQSAESLIANFDSTALLPHLRSAARKEAEEYRSFFRQWEEQTAVLDTARIRSIVEPVLTVPDRYRASAAGRSAEQAFRSIQSAWEKGDQRTAFQFCKVANFTRAQFIVRSRFRYRNIFDRVRSTSTERSTTDALTLLDSLVAAETTNPAAGEFRDSVAHWRSVLTDEMHEERVEARKYHSTEVFNRTVGVAVGIVPLFSGSRSDVHWKLRPEGFTATVPADVSKLGGSSGVAGALAIGYSYTPVLSQHLTVELGSLKQGTVTVGGREISVDLKSSILRFGTSVRYALSSTTGVRNFVSAGAGWVHMERKEQSVYIGDIVYPGGATLDKYHVLADKFSSADVNGEFGVEYLSGSNSDLLLDGSVGFRYRLKEQTVDGAWSVYLTFHAGLFLW